MRKQQGKGNIFLLPVLFQACAINTSKMGCMTSLSFPGRLNSVLPYIRGCQSTLVSSPSIFPQSTSFMSCHTSTQLYTKIIFLVFEFPLPNYASFFIICFDTRVSEQIVTVGQRGVGSTLFPTQTLSNNLQQSLASPMSSIPVQNGTKHMAFQENISRDN